MILVFKLWMKLNQETKNPKNRERNGAKKYFYSKRVSSNCAQKYVLGSELANFFKNFYCHPIFPNGKNRIRVQSKLKKPRHYFNILCGLLCSVMSQNTSECTKLCDDNLVSSI